MCDDFGSDSGSFDDVGSSDFDSDIGSNIDSSDLCSDIDTMDFDDVETIDFDDDISGDFDTSDFSDDIDSMDFDDVESIDLDDDIGDDFDTDIETMDFDDDIESLDIDDDIETLDIDDEIETHDIDDDLETLDIEDDIEALDLDNDIETIDIEDDIEVSELSEDIEDMNMEDISDDAFEIEEVFDDSEMDIAEEDADFEAEIAEMEEMTEAMEVEDSDINSEIDSMEFDDEAEAMDMVEEFEDIDETASDDISEDFDFDNGIEDIDISENIESMEFDDENITELTDGISVDSDDDSFDILGEISTDTDDLEDALTDFETENCDSGDIPTYVDADESTTTSEDIDWNSMLSDGDRDYINGIINNENYSQEQKDFFVNEFLGEVYERETAEPEYGARVKGLTYDSRDIITKPPEDYGEESYIDESTVDDVLNNENLSAENLNNLRDYLENVSNDESLTDDEKSFLINQALGAMSDTNGISHDSYSNPSSFEGINESNVSADVTESIYEGSANEYNEPFSGELSEQDIDTVYEGLSEYDFHGVDCFEDTERLDSSLENFTSENWENLSLNEQKEKMTDLAQYIIDVTGLKNPPKIEFYNSGQDGDYGGFNRATNTLSINEHMLYQNDEAADTVAHELWHAYQYERASNPSTKLDHMYLENFNDYIIPDDDFEGYQSQILESEARAFAQQIKDRLHSY